MNNRSYKLTMVSAPLIEAVTLAETKEFLRIEDNDSDSLINSLIKVARQTAENFMRRSLITQTLTMSFDDYISDKIELAMGDIQSIESIKLTDKDGNITTVNNSKYYLSADTLNLDIIAVSHKIDIEYKAGYGDDIDNLPEPIRQGIKMHVAKMYDNRTGNNTMPIATKHLYMPYRNNNITL